MRAAAKLRCRLRSVFLRGSIERELDEELRYHIERQIEEDIRNGLSPEAAVAATRRSLAGIEARKDECRDARGLNFADNLVRDLRFAMRQLRKNAGFSAIAILVIALSLSAAVAIFAYADAALVRPLSYAASERLVSVTGRAPMFPFANLSYPDYLDWKQMNSVFQSLDVYAGTGFLLGSPAGADPVPAARVSDGFFRTLAVLPVLGRDFYAGEDLPAAAARTVILSYSAWQHRFGGRKDIIGQTVSLSGIPYEIIAVLPSNFVFAPLGKAEIWTTLDSSGSCARRRSCHNLTGIARLHGEVSVASALANMKSIAQNLERQYPDSNRGLSATVLPLAQIVSGPVRPLLHVLSAGTALLLLIGFVNVASLLLVRAEQRRRELALRGALGASTGRLISQFVTEGLVLVSLGGLAGLLAGGWIIQLLLGLIPADMRAEMPFFAGLGLSLRVVLFATAVLLVAAIVFSLIPVAHCRLSTLRHGLVEGSRGTAGLTWRRLGSKLVVLEFAAAMVLLAGGGALVKSVHGLLRVELGFQPDHLVTMYVDAPTASYDKKNMPALIRDVIDSISRVPGVQSAAVSSLLPVSYNGNTDWIRIVGRPYHGEHNEVNAREVSPAYLPTLGARLRQGRFFTEADDFADRRVVIINRKLALQYFPGQDPIGKQIGDTSLSPQSLKYIVGVVDDIREGSLNSEIFPAVYVPFNLDPGTDFFLVVRTSEDPAAMLSHIRAALRRSHPDLGTRDELTMEQRIRMSPAAYLHRSAAWLVGGFAAFALCLGVVGLYGVIAYAVSQRTREIGVRMALGAPPHLVYRLILREAAVLVLIAAALGVAGWTVAGALLQGVFYGVRSWDPVLLSAVTVVLVGSAMLASYIPARRAAAVNPVESLRAE